MQESSNKRLPSRRFIVITVLLITIVTILIVAITNSFVVFRADGATVITIKNNDNSGAKIIEGNGSYIGLVPTGNYSVTANSLNGSTSFSYKSKPFSINNQTIDIKNAVEAEAVSNIAMSSIREYQSSLYFVNTTDTSLESISQSGQRQRLGDLTVYDVAWYGSANSKGLIVGGRNGTYTIASIDGSNISEIGLLGGKTSARELSVAVSLNTLYVLQDGSLYSSPLTETNFNPVDIKIPFYSSILAATDQNISVREGIGTDFKLANYNLKTKDKKEVSLPFIERAGYITGADWSSDGKYLSLVNGGRGVIYDNSLNEVYVFSLESAGSAVWKDSGTLIYSGSGFLYSLDMDTKRSDAIGRIPNNVRINRIFKSSMSDEYIYATKLLNSRTSIVRFPLKDQPVNTSGNILGESDMQTLSENCDIRFSNYKTVAVYSSGFYASIDSCKNRVNSYLDSIRIDPESVYKQIFQP